MVEVECPSLCNHLHITEQCVESFFQEKKKMTFHVTAKWLRSEEEAVQRSGSSWRNNYVLCTMYSYSTWRTGLKWRDWCNICTLLDNKKKKERLLACSMTAASLTTTHRVNFRCTFLRHQFSPQKHSPPLPEVTHRLGDKESVCWRSIPVDDVETDSPMSKCNLLASYVACLSVHWPLWDLVLRYWMTRHFVILDRK